ncbi:VCBS repeat-containing protein [Celeribacter arenosi]|uniref:VCBS repeat-containing protein n=1 Tax=Celeribacter arenosi TaxID=792649 RepID=A0ABP7KCE7_9RHOB
MRGLALIAMLMAEAAGAEILSARYMEPTGVYGHGAIPGGEYGGLEVRLSPDRVLGVGTYDNVYEDTKPRLADLDGDGTVELVTVISYFDRGAAIRVFDEVDSPDHPLGTTLGVVAETAPIGRRYRWLSIAGIADFDGNGRMDIAYVDRPHLAKELVIVEARGSGPGLTLHETARVSGLTNHHLGSPVIEGGVRVCDGMYPVILTADAKWKNVVENRLSGGEIVSTPVAPYTGPDSFAPFLDCD